MSGDGGREGRRRAFRLALLEWSLAGFALGAWVLAVEVLRESGTARIYPHSIVLLLSGGYVAWEMRKAVAAGKETVWAVPLIVMLSLLVPLPAVYQISRGEVAWALATPCLAYGALGFWTAWRGMRADLPRGRPGRAIPPEGQRLATAACWWIRGSVVAAIGISIFGATDPGFVVFVPGIFIGGFLWLLGAAVALRRVLPWLAATGVAGALAAWAGMTLLTARLDNDYTPVPPEVAALLGLAAVTTAGTWFLLRRAARRAR